MRRAASGLLLVGAGLCAAPTTAQGQTLVASDWALKPSAVSAGDKFRLIFATSTNNNATSTNIADYNDVVQDLAATGHSSIQPYSSGFQVVGCTASVDARDNTSTTYTSTDKGVPVYWLNGNKVADDYEDFYDGSWDDEANPKDESGNNRDLSTGADSPFTGCDHDGTEAMFSGSSRGLGATGSVRVGKPNSSNSGDGPIGSSSGSGRTNSRPMYGLSEVFQVVSQTVSNDATLSALAVTDGDGNAVTLSPIFDPAEDTYAASVGNTVSRITFDPTVGNENATVKYLDDDDAELTDADTMTDEFDVDLAVGANVIKVKVTAQDENTTLTYEVTVTWGGQVCTAPDLGGRTEVWSATLTVEPVNMHTFQVGNGYDANGDGSLSNTSFEFASHSVTITGLRESGGQVDLRMTISGNEGFAPLEPLRLHFCDETRDLSEATQLGDNAGLQWSRDQYGYVDWTSTVTIEVALSVQANTSAVGKPTIEGTPAFRSTLTASPDNITDANGLQDVVYSYQWVRIDDGLETEIPDADGSTYVLTSSDIGKSIKVTAEFTDDNGYLEARSSDPTDPVTALTCSALSLGSRTEIWSATLTVEPVYMHTFQVGNGYDANGDGSLSNTSFEFASHSVTITGLRESGGQVDLRMTISGNEGFAPLEPLRLHFCDETRDLSEATQLGDNAGLQWSRDEHGYVDWSFATTIELALSSPPASNTLATGMPVIMGTAHVGETLTASTD